MIIKAAVRRNLIHSGALVNLWAECLYAVCKVRNWVVGVKGSINMHYLFTGVKPTDAYLRTLRCNALVRVPDKKGELSKRNIDMDLSCTIYDRKYCVIFGRDEAIHISRNCIV